ncbi:MAG: hypothetical protein ABIL23_02155 [candidate division WOR-3 bacterium]
MKGIISKFLAGKITLAEAIQKHEGFKILMELILYNEEVPPEARINTRNIGKLSGLSTHISSILRKLEADGWIILYTPENPHPKNNPPRIPIPTIRLKKLFKQE